MVAGVEDLHLPQQVFYAVDRGILALQPPHGGNLVVFCQGFALVTGKRQVFGGIFYDTHYRLRVQRRAIVAIAENLATGDNAEAEFIAEILGWGRSWLGFGLRFGN